MKKHFVIFYSPGTLFSESTQLPIASWNVQKAITMSLKIKERYGATPYGFCFITKERGNKDLDSRTTKSSGMYFLGGKIWTLAQVEAKHDPKDKILISNMKGNHWDRVIENTNSWKVTLPFTKKDKVVQLPTNTGRQK